MIDKLYNLKKNQTEQKLIEKANLEQEIFKIEEDIESTTHRINTATVDKFGSISDFMILAMHKDSLRFHIEKQILKKNSLQAKVDNLFMEIVELQKESEQYKYILEEEKSKKQKALLDLQNLESEEFIQSKYIRA